MFPLTHASSIPLKWVPLYLFSSYYIQNFELGSFFLYSSVLPVPLTVLAAQETERKSEICQRGELLSSSVSYMVANFALKFFFFWAILLFFFKKKKNERLQLFWWVLCGYIQWCFCFPRRMRTCW